MGALRERLSYLFGRRWKGNELVVFFSARLDETGTDGSSPYTVVGGAIATVDQWERLDLAWERMLATYKVPEFHSKEFNAEDGIFRGWSDLKRRRFSDRQHKICQRNSFCRISVGVDNSTHAEVKKEMKGIKGFVPDSNYGLC